MQEIRSQAQESAEDLFFGQVVIIWARWFVILAGIILILFSATTISALTFAVLLISPLIAINFFVHGRYLMERPINRILLLSLSVLDILIITAIVLLWKPTGAESQFFVFYYPLVAAFAFVFLPSQSAIYTLFTLILYAGAYLLMDFPPSSFGLEVLAMRLITIGAMGGLATYYWRIQRDRRRAIPELQP